MTSERDTDPVEEYLDAVLLTSPGSPREVRRTLAEVEDHLLESVDALLAAGLTLPAARAEAVRRMGAARFAVDRPSLARLLLLPRPLRRRVLLTALLLAGVGGLFVGIAGAVAAAVQVIWGPAAIATPFPTGAYSQADCQRWLAAYPSRHNCVAAMTADHAADFLRNAALASVLGIGALVVRGVLRRRWRIRSLAAEALLGAGLAAACALIFAASAFDAYAVSRGAGAGQPVSLSVAALGATALLLGMAKHISAVPLWRQRPNAAA